MEMYVPVFLHLFSRMPETLTYNQWVQCKRFADDWIKAQKE